MTFPRAPVSEGDARSRKRNSGATVFWGDGRATALLLGIFAASSCLGPRQDTMAPRWPSAAAVQR